MKEIGEHFGVHAVTVGVRSGSMKSDNIRMLNLTGLLLFAR